MFDQGLGSGAGQLQGLGNDMPGYYEQMHRQAMAQAAAMQGSYRQQTNAVRGYHPPQDTTQPDPSPLLLLIDEEV